MTRDRAFKKTVRARMARTNERYATARAALLGELAKKSPPRARHDQTFALKRLLGDAVSEAWLLGVGGGVSFQYNAFEYRGVPPLVYLGTRCNPQYAYDETFVVRALEGLGREARVSTSTSAAKAERELFAALEGGPVICWVGREALFEAEDFGGATPWVVVVHDVEDGVAGVEDGVVGPLEIPLERLATARAAVKKQKHRMIALGESDGVDPAAAARAGIERCVLDLDGGVVLGGAAQNFGLAALEKWTKLVVDPKDAKGWPKLFARGARLLEGMRQISTWIGASTDGAAFRAMYADFLREAAEHGVATNEAVELVDANAKAWRALVEDVFVGAPPVLDAARTTLAKSKEPASPRALTALRDQAEADLDEAFADSFRERLHARLERLCAGERAARDALAAAVG